MRFEQESDFASAQPDVRRSDSGGTRQAAGKARSLFGPEREADLNHGQQVIIIARWILVLGALVLTLWNPAEIAELRLQIAFILVLAVGNFYLHAQMLKGRPVWGEVVLIASLVDITVISIMVGISKPPFESNIFAFYFPAILAFAVAFPTLMTLVLAGGAIAIYAAIGFTSPSADESVMTMRLLMMAAVAVCGTIYWRTERSRRRAASDAQHELFVQIREGEVATDARRASPATPKEGN